MAGCDLIIWVGSVLVLDRLLGLPNAADWEGSLIQTGSAAVSSAYVVHHTTRQLFFWVEVIGEKDSCGGLDLAKGTVP